MVTHKIIMCCNIETIGGCDRIYKDDVKSEVVNNVLLQMSNYIDSSTIDILQKVMEEQFVHVNMEEISTLPAVIKTSVEQQNKYLIELFKFKKKNLTLETRKQYASSVLRLTSVIEKPLSQIDEVDIDYYLRWYQNHGIGIGNRQIEPSTYNSERRYLSAFFAWMKKEKIIQNNPVGATEVIKEIRKPIDYYTTQQMEEMKEGCASLRDRAIFEVLRSTGARIGEIPQINIEDIDRKTGNVCIISEKSKRYRYLYIDEVAMYHLDKYLKSREDNEKALFVWERSPYKRLSKHGIRSCVNKIANRINADYRVYPHKWRKTLGMSLIEREVDIGIIQQVMGHANPTVTSKYYAESSPESLRSVRKRAGC